MVTVGESVSHGLVLDVDNEALLWVSSKEKGLCQSPPALPTPAAPPPRELSVKGGEQSCSWQLWSAVEKSNFPHRRGQWEISRGVSPGCIFSFVVSSGRGRGVGVGWREGWGWSGGERLKCRKCGIGRVGKNRGNNQSWRLSDANHRHLGELGRKNQPSGHPKAAKKVSCKRAKRVSWQRRSGRVGMSEGHKRSHRRPGMSE